MDTQDQNNFELIERFFSNSLNPEELRQFDLRIQNDAAFAKDVSLYQSIHSNPGIPTSSTPDKSTNNIWKWGLLILFCITAFFIWKDVGDKSSVPPSETEEEKKEEIITPPVLIDPPTSIDDPEKDTLIPNKDRVQIPPKVTKPADQIESITKEYLGPLAVNIKKSDGYQELYRQEKYAQVIELLPEELPPLTNSDNIEQALLLSTALIFEEDYESAINYLEILETEENIIRQKADVKWYLGLSYLFNRQPKKAISILQSLSDTKYADKAKALLDELFR